jgi:hypothetical protein
VSTKIACTLDRNRIGPGLDLAADNVTVTTTQICDFNRAIFGTLAVGSGTYAYETWIWSDSQPLGGLVNLVSIGLVAEGLCSLKKYVGSQPYSYGFRPADGRVDNNGLQISSNSAGAIPKTAERQCIGTYLDMTGATPFAVWAVNGNTVWQQNLPAGKFWLPALSIGSTIAGDIKAETNFGGNRLLDYPFFRVFK